MRGKIYIDCSITYNVSFVTGIQRVVRNIIDRKDIISDELSRDVIPVVFNGESYQHLDDYLRSNLEFKVKEGVKGILGSLVKSKRVYNFSKYCYRKLKDINLFIRHKRHSLNFNNQNKSLISFNSGDILLIADSYYNPDYKNRYFSELIKDIKKKGVKVMLLVYDIIAMTNPEYFDDYMAKELDEYLKYFLGFSDFLITISQSEKAIIEHYLKGLNINKKVSYFYLGSDLEKINDVKEDWSTKTDRFKPYFLVVGTLEPRKGHEVVLSAFEKLWKEGFQYNLVFAGRVGWKVDSLLERINASLYLKKNFYVLNDVSDELLTALYRNAYACICATIREGFGLPLVEAIHFDKPVVSSDIGVAKEVGNGYPVYFKCGDPDDLAKSVLYLTQSGSNSNKANFKPLSWDESVKMLCERLKKWI